MSNYKTCIVVDNKLYCWDQNKRKVVVANIVEDNMQEPVSNEIFDTLMLKVLKDKGLIKEGVK